MSDMLAVGVILLTTISVSIYKIREEGKAKEVKVQSKGAVKGQ